MSDLELQLGKSCKISTELRPLIYAKILFPVSILSIYRTICFKLCIEVHIGIEGVVGDWRWVFVIVLALDLFLFRYILSIYWPIFFTLCIIFHISGRSGLLLKMGRFCKISTE